MPPPRHVVFLNGVYGVGKTAVLEHLGDALAAAERPFALFDVDWFHRSWPPSDQDPGNVLIEAANMQAAWRNYRRIGDRQPIVSGVLETEADTTRYETVFDLPVRAVLLTASPPAIQARLHGRYAGDRPDALAWHLDRHLATADRIEAGGQYEATIDTDGLDAAEVASLIVARFELLT